jgi:hypothetical protein
MKIEGSGSICQRQGSADPDPHQNVMDPRNPCFSPDEAVGAAPLLDLSLQAHLLPEQGWQ